MKAKCIATRLTAKQKKRLGLKEGDDPHYPFVIGNVYPVLGLHTQTGYYAGTMLIIPMRYAVFAPLCLFEIVDDRPSKYWKIRKNSYGEITLWPEEFYEEYFQDDLTNGVQEVVEIYNKVVEQFKKELD